MSNEEGKKLPPERIALIVIAVLLLIAVGYIVISSLVGNDAEAPPAAIEAGTAAPVALEEGAEQPKEVEAEEAAGDEAEATPTGPKRLVLESTPTPFHTTSEDDPRAMLDLAVPDHFDYFDRPDEWYDYDSEGFGAYSVGDGTLYAKDYTPEDNAVYWSYNAFSSGNTYAEINATNGDCIGKDAVGFVIRIDPSRTPSGYALDIFTAEEIAALQNDLAALNGRTNPVEARQVAETAIRYSALLADEYELIRPAVLHNVLVRIGLKDRGLCHHWTADLMKQLELLELQSYHLYWGVAHRGSELREHNSVVVAAKGQNFENGIVLDPWRNSGELYWIRVKGDRYPWKERPHNE